LVNVGKLFKKAPPAVEPKEQLRAWRKVIKAEQRALDRQMRSTSRKFSPKKDRYWCNRTLLVGIEREEAKIRVTILDSNKRGDTDTMKMLAKELVASRRARERLLMSRTQLGSLEMQLTSQVAMQRVTQEFARSTEIMTLMNNLIRLPELNQTMQNMSKEMMKAGVIEEMMDDAISSALDEDDLEEDAEAEVDHVLEEILQSQFKDKNLNVPARASANQEEDVDVEEDSALQQRLSALRS
jgi:charged multivesicular body protein 3